MRVRDRGDVNAARRRVLHGRGRRAGRDRRPSGAGKTTLLDAVAGVAPATSGSVRFDGIDVHANRRTFRGVLGYVPQDDIVHAELPLRRTLRYAARLRLPSSTTAAEIDEAVA